MRLRGQVTATQIFTGRGEIRFPRVIPTPNRNCPRTGNDFAENNRQPLWGGKSSELRCRYAVSGGLVPGQLRLVLLQLSIEGSLSDAQQPRGDQFVTAGFPEGAEN